MSPPLPAPTPPAAASAAPSRHAAWLGAGLIVLALVAAYWNSHHVPLLLDDTAALVENPSIRRLWPLGPVLSPPSDVGTGGRPVANLSFALNYAAGGLSVRGYHAVNLAIHAAAALVLFGLVRRTLVLPVFRDLAWLDAAAARRIALGAALFWSLHPLQTESVTYLSQRTESLMGLLYLATVYAFLRATTERCPGFAALAVACCALGMATKEVMVTAPVVVLFFDRTFLAGSFRAAWAERRRLHLALAATWALLVFLLADVHERGIGHAAVSNWHYALTSCRSILTYLGLAFWPAPLVFDYGTAVATSLAEVWPYVVGLAALVGATLVALWRAPRLGFLGAWTLGILAPASSFVPVAGQPTAEHRVYLSLAALAVGAALVLVHRLGRFAAPAGAILAVALGVATAYRNHDYRSALALWTDTVAKRPDNARAHAALGAARFAAGELSPAISSLQRAVELDPRSAEARNNLASALHEAGRPAEAVPHFTAALALRPRVASTHYNFGNALLALGRPAEALAQQTQALLARPDFPEASCARADALSALGRLAEAIPHYRTALRGRPELAAAHFGLARALAQTGAPADALGHYETTARLVPDSREVHFNAAGAAIGLQRWPDAERHLRAALRLDSGLIDAHFALANVLAVTDRPADAIPHYEAVLKARPDFAEARANLEIVRRSVPVRAP